MANRIIIESYVTLSGANGKFSGGFDISAFGDEEPKGTSFGSVFLM